MNLIQIKINKIFKLFLLLIVNNKNNLILFSVFLIIFSALYLSIKKPQKKIIISSYQKCINNKTVSGLPNPCEKILDVTPTINKKSEIKIKCRDLCGDSICQEIPCQKENCACRENTNTCPIDCKKNDSNNNIWDIYEGVDYIFKYPSNWKPEIRVITEMNESEILFLGIPDLSGIQEISLSKILFSKIDYKGSISNLKTANNINEVIKVTRKNNSYWTFYYYITKKNSSKVFLLRVEVENEQTKIEKQLDILSESFNIRN